MGPVTYLTLVRNMALSLPSSMELTVVRPVFGALMIDCPPLRTFAHVLSGGHVHTGGLSENCRFARHADPGADLHQGELAIPLASTKSDSVPCAACRHVKKSRLRASRLDGVRLIEGFFAEDIDGQ